MKVYAFDVDETLEVSAGPVKLADVADLVWRDGHIVGLCGNFAMVTMRVPNWHRVFSFIGPMEMLKENFLTHIKTYVPADEYIMVGNIPGVSGSSNDYGAAALAGWRFIREAEFAAGSR